ncbi:MAG: hypothetical protein ACRDMZ_19705 [Solirubrobacteraceae bacterium]
MLLVSALGLGRRRADRDHALLRGDGVDDLGLRGLLLLEMVTVAEHAEVAGHAAVGVDRDPGQDLLALVEAEALHVELRQPDPVRGVGRVLAIVCVQRDLKRAQVGGDLLDRGRHRSSTVAADGRRRRRRRRRAPGGRRMRSERRSE